MTCDRPWPADVAALDCVLIVCCLASRGSVSRCQLHWMACVTCDRPWPTAVAALNCVDMRGGLHLDDWPLAASLGGGPA